MTTPSGFNCETCGTFHAYSVYALAHCDVELMHTCSTCGAQHSILDCTAKLLTPGVKPAEAPAPVLAPAAVESVVAAPVVEEPPADQFRKGDVWNNSRGTPFLVQVIRQGVAHMVNLKTHRTYNRPWDDLGWKSGRPWVRVSCGAQAVKAGK